LANTRALRIGESEKSFLSKFICQTDYWLLLGGCLTSVSDLNGKKVIGASAFALGEVEGAEFDAKNWQITHLQVKLTGEATEQLGFKKPTLGHTVVLLPVTLVKAVGDIVSLDKSIQELKSVVEPKKD
jgi:sporulation protein YlmC with PRC-barrel domain